MKQLHDLKDAPGDLLTVEEVAKRLKVSRPTVFRFVRKGLLPKVAFTARTVRYRPEDVDFLVRSMERGGGVLRR